MRRIFDAWDRVLYEFWFVRQPQPRYAVVRVRRERR
ncbi:hypothetical protein Dform_00037 [Dehalogenimonas formicexedens]|uniref:Uncharacterized protein n=1 Tax=Dehalogenimonas formicexedens TaxID=1839801 RepID=A0A1P8F4W7_9CHLR|nr:hypothetical protein Dform_00037 [Dehalogenimonas formicexedens]